jgi:hypothetical protein
MFEISYDGSLEGLLAILDRCRDVSPAALPDRIRRAAGLSVPSGGSSGQPELWSGSPAGQSRLEAAQPGQLSVDSAVFPKAACPADKIMHPQGSAAWTALSEISADGCTHFLNGWMSEFPVEAQLIRFARKIFAAAESAGGGRGNAERQAAEKVVSDRCDPAIGVVLEVSYKAWKETDRLFGLLRFSPSPSGIHTAYCTPDHFVLPALADHFALRFGVGTPWAVIDERRDIALYCAPGGEPLLIREPSLEAGHSGPDSWEQLWRTYHQTINNEARSNPDLQRRFMPRRYWKYLPEMR